MSIELEHSVLMKVEKPSRYTGYELNSIYKDFDNIDIRFAFCFPDAYEIGMSNLGMKIIYHLLNNRDDTYCQRVFAPWTDMEEQMKLNNIPLFSIETKHPINSFDFVGFTLQYEMSYTNIINMLRLSNISILSNHRGENDPIICAGGPCACNPEPLADVIDFFVIGEAEEVLHDIMNLYKLCKKESIPKKQFLDKVSQIQGVYVPSLYEVKYNQDNTIDSITHKNNKTPPKIKKRIIKNLDTSFFPGQVIVPFTSIVHDRIMLEMFRGCIRGCRFCQAGFIYRPVRERSVQALLRLANLLEKSTGYEEISLVSLSTSDYSKLEDFTQKLMAQMESKKVNISLPSLRVDSFSINLMQKAQKVRKAGLTFAPEAGTQRLRDVINKGITESDILNSIKIACQGGWTNIKLYFMIGLPTETLEDVRGIAILCNKILFMAKNICTRKPSISVSVSSFIPKPFTPFQWENQNSIDELQYKQSLLKKHLNRSINYNWHDVFTSFLEAVLSRGDRRLTQVIIKANEKGCKFDGWGEQLKFNGWMDAFKECNIDPNFYATRKRNHDEVMPWSHVDIGVTQDFFIKENQKAYDGIVSTNCKEGCLGCGIKTFIRGACIE